MMVKQLKVDDRVLVKYGAHHYVSKVVHVLPNNKIKVYFVPNKLNKPIEACYTQFKKITVTNCL